MEYQNNHNENSDQNRKADNRKFPHNRNNGQEKKTSITRIGGKNRGNANGHNALKGREPQKGNDRHGPENISRESADHRQGKLARKGGRPHYDHLNRQVRTKREETVEDIKADVEQIEKDIQFEIRQIRSIKLGL